MTGVQDAIEVVNRLIPITATPAERLLLRMITSELRSLHPAANSKREQTRAGKMQAVIDDFASRITQAAQGDIDYASEREGSDGNVCANVSFSFPQTVRWLTYAAVRGNRQARRILNYIAVQRAPMMPQDDDQQAAKVYRLSVEN